MHVPTNVEFDSFPLPSMLELNALTAMNGEEELSQPGSGVDNRSSASNSKLQIPPAC